MPIKTRGNEGSPAQRKKQVFDEFKAGTLNSGKNGPIVKDRKQAIAIALSEAKPRKGAKK
jgi:hypothetical protein